MFIYTLYCIYKFIYYCILVEVVVESETLYKWSTNILIAFTTANNESDLLRLNLYEIKSIIKI